MSFNSFSKTPIAPHEPTSEKNIWKVEEGAITKVELPKTDPKK